MASCEHGTPLDMPLFALLSKVYLLCIFQQLIYGLKYSNDISDSH